jgi:hypothetical protein
MNNIFDSIGFGVNNLLLTPTTYFIKKINGSSRIFIYYDKDIFEDTVILSASQLIGEDITPWEYHYNTMHDETIIYDTIENIAIPIYPVPKSTKIVGLKRMDIGTFYNYHLPLDYDVNNNYTYDWYIVGNANFGQGTNGVVEILDGGKSVDIFFNDIDTITLKCKITNQNGCFRWIIKNLYPGTATKKLMIVRYPYF